MSVSVCVYVCVCVRAAVYVLVCQFFCFRLSMQLEIRHQFLDASKHLYEGLTVCWSFGWSISPLVNW